MNNFIIKGNICFSTSGKELKTLSGYAVCKDGKSAGVFNEIPAEFKNYELRNYGDMLIIPGMVDLHIHAPQYAFRGMGMDYELIAWLNNRTFPEEAKYASTEYAEKAYSIFAESMKNSATTRACIFATKHRAATEILMDLMENTGLITYVGKINMDRNAPDALVEESTDRSAYDTFGWINDIRNRYKRTKPILTPRFIPSCTDALMGELREIQRAYHLPVQSHLSENRDEIKWVQELCPDTAFYGDGYDKFNLFGAENLDFEKVNTVMAHCVWSTDEEVKRMRDNDVFIAHCPASNMNLSSGIAPVRKYLDMDMRIGLGSDIAGGQTESMFRAITDAIQVSKMYRRYIDENAKPVTFEEAFYMATKGGGEFFGEVGSFDEGYEFDAVVLDDSILPHPLDLNVRQRIERAVYLSLDLCGGIKAKYVCGEKIDLSENAAE